MLPQQAPTRLNEIQSARRPEGRPARRVDGAHPSGLAPGGHRAVAPFAVPGWSPRGSLPQSVACTHAPTRRIFALALPVLQSLISSLPPFLRAQIEHGNEKPHSYVISSQRRAAMGRLPLARFDLLGPCTDDDRAGRAGRSETSVLSVLNTSESARPFPRRTHCPLAEWASRGCNTCQNPRRRRRRPAPRHREPVNLRPASYRQHRVHKREAATCRRRHHAQARGAAKRARKSLAHRPRRPWLGCR